MTCSQVRHAGYRALVAEYVGEAFMCTNAWGAERHALHHDKCLSESQSQIRANNLVEGCTCSEGYSTVHVSLRKNRD